MNHVKVLAHDPRWSDEFEVESKRIAACLGENVIAVHHIGSTAILTIHAKPVIDILVEVACIDGVDERSRDMESLGYEVKGEFGIAGRRYFRKDTQGVRTHQVHVFMSGSDEVRSHLAFRDYMIAHPEEAQAYSDLKRALAEKHPNDMDAYMDGKDAFIKDIDQRCRLVT